jgi:regulator of RNase E activity RraA
MLTLASLSNFSSCEISDALIKLGLPHGGYIPDIHLLSPSHFEIRICGPAYTVQMEVASDKSTKLSTHFVDTVPEGSIIVIDTPARSVHPLRSFYYAHLLSLSRG